MLGAYFARLSPRTRDFYGPHRFDQETADRLCRETRTDTEAVRLVVTVADGDGARIIAYFIVGFRMQDADVKRYAARGTPLDDPHRRLPGAVGEFHTRQAKHDMIAPVPALPPEA